MSHQGYSDYILYSDKCLEAMMKKGGVNLGSLYTRKRKEHVAP